MRRPTAFRPRRSVVRQGRTGPPDIREHDLRSGHARRGHLRSSTGQGYANPFPGNIIPQTRFDPTTIKFMNLLDTLGVKAQNSNLTGNYRATVPGSRYSAIPSFQDRSQYFSQGQVVLLLVQRSTPRARSPSARRGNADGLPLEIGGYRGNSSPTTLMRLNYDRTLTPTILLHLGVGYYHTNFHDHAPFLNFDPAAFGLSGF